MLTMIHINIIAITAGAWQGQVCMYVCMLKAYMCLYGYNSYYGWSLARAGMYVCMYVCMLKAYMCLYGYNSYYSWSLARAGVYVCMYVGICVSIWIQ